MQALDIYTANDLPQRTGELLKRGAEGHLGVITDHGKPALLAVPFDDQLIRHGLHRALALRLVEAQQITPAHAAQLAGMDLAAFIELLAANGIDAVDYPPEELHQDYQHALAASHHR